MNREKLMSEVKTEYARLASQETRQHIIQAVGSEDTEPYYENLLNMVLSEISTGRFDSFHNGAEIVEAVANDKKKWLPDWKHDN